MGKSLTNANQQQYRDEVGELIANYVVNVSDKLDARTERASKAVLIDSIAVAIAALRHPAAQNARKQADRGFRFVTFTKDSSLLPAAVGKEVAALAVGPAVQAVSQKGYT